MKSGAAIQRPPRRFQCKYFTRVLRRSCLVKHYIAFKKAESKYECILKAEIYIHQRTINAYRIVIQESSRIVSADSMSCSNIKELSDQKISIVEIKLALFEALHDAKESSSGC